MRAESYKTKAGLTLYRPIVSEDEMGGIDNTGFCLACGEECSGVEPDARKYTCEGCGQPRVYGLEELLMMGILRLEA